MRKIRNPFPSMAGSHEYQCFGCSPFNQNGLQMEFSEDGDFLVAKWRPRKSMEGWIGVLHGGIQAALVDELAGWVIMIKRKTAGVTTSLNVRFLKPVMVSKGDITISGKIITSDERNAKVECTLYDGENQPCLSAEAEYFCYPENIAKKRFKYPGIEAFYESDQSANTENSDGVNVGEDF